MSHMAQSELTPVISAAPHERIGALRRPALWVAGGGAVFAVAGFFLDRPEFWNAYLLAWLFWLGMGLGGLGLGLLHHVSGGRWSEHVRPIAESAALTLPVVGLLFVPMLLAMPHIFPWADGQQMAANELWQQKSDWLNVPFFVGRAALYFAVWVGLVLGLNRLSSRVGADDPESIGRPSKGFGAVGMILYILTTTFAAFDWMMSLEPAWFSSIYGLHFLVGHFVAGVSLAIVGLAARSSSQQGKPGWGDRLQTFNDLGNLLLAGVMTWAYFAYSQFLIIWSANIPEEAVWYVHRSRGGWQWVAVGLVVLHFGLPFVLLLSRSLKRNPRVLAGLAGLLLCVQAVDLYWLAVPAFHPDGFHIHWLYPLLLVGMGAAWLAIFVGHLSRGSHLLGRQTEV